MNESTATRIMVVLADKIKDLEMMRDYYNDRQTEALAENQKLAKRIAELEARNAELEARNAELEAKNAELESLVDRMEKSGILEMEKVNDD
jgi:predicted nuclease with TOPRIM domain